jgi:Uma2 family endonuclease
MGDEMSQSSPVVVYDTKPYTEWILGGPVQKAGANWSHAMLQGELYCILRPLDGEYGRAGIEWTLWLQPPGEVSRYLVPDAAFISYERLPRECKEEAEEPHIAPDAVFEILMPSDLAEHIAHKIDVYLRSGTSLIAFIDPKQRTIRLIDSDFERTLSEGDTFRHAALPDFRFDVGAFFAHLDR